MGSRLYACSSGGEGPSPLQNHGKGDFDRKVEDEVTRRLKLAEAIAFTDNEECDCENGGGEGDVIEDKKSDGKGGKKDGRPRRFVTEMSRFATGAARVAKTDFLKAFDYGIPIPPSKRDGESDPGQDEALILYGKDKALPNDRAAADAAMYLPGDGDDKDLPILSASDATANCHGLNVIFTQAAGGINQCLAIVGNFESYHVQRWLRLSDSTYKLDVEAPLKAVGRGMQSNGMDKFSAPSSSSTEKNRQLLLTYFDRYDDTVSTLKPIAKRLAGEDNTVIVMVCNTGQSDLLANFLCSADARGFGDLVRSKVLVFATDEGTRDLARGLGVEAFYDEKIFEKMPEKEARTYGDRDFTSMMYAKVVTVQLINMLGHDVLFQDVDLVWFKNPLAFFHDKANPLYEFDMLFQDDGARSLRYAPYSANTGFYYVRNSEKTKFLFRNLLYMGDMVLSMTSHQQALAALLDEHASLTGLRVKTLSGAEFPGGYHYHRKKEHTFLKDIAQGKIVPYLFHMSWTTNKENKLKFLKQYGLWYLKDACERGGGVEAARALSGNDTGDRPLQSTCCSAERLVTCFYKDKPSAIPCEDSPTIDKNGKSFW